MVHNKYSVTTNKILAINHFNKFQLLSVQCKMYIYEYFVINLIRMSIKILDNEIHFTWIMMRNKKLFFARF